MPKGNRLDAALIKLSHITPNMGWDSVLQAVETGDSRLITYLDAVKQTASTVRLIPGEDSHEHWVYHFLHQAAWNLERGRTPSPLGLEVPFSAVPEAAMPEPPFLMRPGTVNALNIRWMQQWLRETHSLFKSKGWVDTQQDSLISLRREWFFFRYQGCGWSYPEIADEYSTADDNFRTSRTYLEGADIGRDIRNLAKRINLKTSRSRNNRTWIS